VNAVKYNVSLSFNIRGRRVRGERKRGEKRKEKKRE
jgi:hypothetical protein